MKKKMIMKVEEMIRQYVSTLTGRDDIDVEITENTVVLSREGWWHIYVISGRFTAIGCFLDEDIDIYHILRKNEGNIRYIYDNRMEDEAVQ